MRIQNKLFSIFFLSSTLLVVSLSVIVQWSLDEGMLEYVNEREVRAITPMAEALRLEYEKAGNWQDLYDNHRLFQRLLATILKDSAFEPPGDHERHRPPPPPRGNRPGPRFAPDRNRRPPVGMGPPPKGRAKPPAVSYALVDRDKMLIVGFYPEDLEYSYIDIRSGDNLVGYLAVSKRPDLAEGYELNFISQQQNYLLGISAVLLGLTLLITLPLAHHLVKPIRLLASAMTKLSKGNYQQELAIERKDEFAGLSRDFNMLAKTLASNEQARRRWLADISHELRTPVAVLKGELEAMLDGVRPLSRGNIQSANEELNQLQRLIEDLYELTRTDLGALHYRKSELNIGEYLLDSAEKFRSKLVEKGTKLVLDIPLHPIYIEADGDRLKQLFSNLFTNICRYAQNSTQAIISLDDDNNQVKIVFEDDGIGVGEQHLNKLFDHLYRLDESRNRETGGSGLGLSICRQIVEAHRGKISASRSELGGLAITIAFPEE